MHGLLPALDPAPHYESAHSLHFGDPGREAGLVSQDTIAVPLLHLGTLAVGGADAETFLQGQLSNDVRRVTAQQGQLSSYNSPKGRMLAVLVLYRDAAGQLKLELPANILEPVLRRLRMYVLRSRVQLQDVSAEARALGLAGIAAEQRLVDLQLPVPAAAWQTVRAGNVVVMRRPGTLPRFSLHVPGAEAGHWWGRLAATSAVAGTNAWKLLDIRAGLPSVHPETQDHFVPQMANLDQLEGINFQKGCYTGQEIVARLHYLGEVKRRMYRLKAETAPVNPGTPVYDAEREGQSCGEVVDSALTANGCELLAVLQTTHIHAERLRLGSANGPVLRLPC